MAAIDNGDFSEHLKSEIIRVEFQEFCTRTSFYLHSGLLRSRSAFFEIAKEKNDAGPIRTFEIRSIRAKTFAIFAQRLYQVIPVDISWDAHTWEAASKLNAIHVKNCFLDDCQTSSNLDSSFMKMCLWLHSKGFEESLLMDYMLEKMAYELLTGGWTRFINLAESPVGGDIFPALDAEKIVAPLEMMGAKLEELQGKFCRGKLEDPAERKDCRWHEHTEKDKKRCPRHKEEK